MLKTLQARPALSAAPRDDNDFIFLNEAPEVSIVMPCLNEASSLGNCIRKAKAFLKENLISGEIVVADNGSTDASCAIAQQTGAIVIEAQIKGYGSALMAGIKKARGRYIIIGDSDGSYDFSDLMPFMQALRAGNDLVVGNRFKGGIAAGAMPFLHQYFGNPILSFIGSFLFGSPCKDFHCGLRGFNRHSLLGLNLMTTGMEFASEMIVRASLSKLKICEVPVTLSQDARGSKSHLRSWRDGWRHLRFLLLSSPMFLYFPGLKLENQDKNEKLV